MALPRVTDPEIRNMSDEEVQNNLASIVARIEAESGTYNPVLAADIIDSEISKEKEVIQPEVVKEQTQQIKNNFVEQEEQQAKVTTLSPELSNKLLQLFPNEDISNPEALANIKRKLEKHPSLGGSTLHELNGYFGELNKNYNVEEHYDKEWDKQYDLYTEQLSLCEKNNDVNCANTAHNQWDALKGIRNKFQGNYECTVEGLCGEGTVNMTEDLTEDIHPDNLKHFTPFMESLRRTQGSLDSYGKPKSDEQLIENFKKSEVYKEWSAVGIITDFFTKKLISEQDKRDLGLQYLVWKKLKTEGKDIVTGLAAISTDTILAPVGLVVKGTQATAKSLGLVGEGSKSPAVNSIKKLFSKPFTTPAGLGASLTGSYTFADIANQQDTLVKAGLQESTDWEQVGLYTGIASTFGGTVGLLLGGLSKKANELIERHMIKNDMVPKDVLKQMREQVTDEKGLFKWFRKLGWSRKETKAELKALEKEGLSFDKKTNVWTNNKGQEYKPGLTIRGTEKATFAERGIKEEDTQGTIEARNLNTKAQEVLDEKYITVQNKDLGIPFSRTGQKAFDWFDNVMGDTTVRLLYGGDATLVKSGLGRWATGMSDAEATIQLNVSRIAGDLKNFTTKYENDLGDLAKLIRERKPVNKFQEEYLKLIDIPKLEQLRMSRKMGIITKKQYHKFITDNTYLPRFWKTQDLITDKGAAKFSDFLQDMWTTNPKAVRKIIDNLTGASKKDSAEADAIINSRFSTSSVRNMFRNKADREMDVHRSAHLEHERKLKLPAHLEHKLDEFMAPVNERWADYFNDVIKRNEYARRFGAKDQKVLKEINKLEKTGREKAAGHLEEYYFTGLGVPKKEGRRGSASIAAALKTPRLMKGISKINAYQTVSKLGLAAIPNSTQAFVNGTVMLAKSGSLLTAPFKAVNAIGRAIIKTTRDADIIHRGGVLGEMDMAKIASENMPHSRIIEREFKGPLKYLNEPTKFLRATGFIGVEGLNRSAAAIMGNMHAQSVHSKFQRLLLRGEGNTLKAKKIEKELKSLGINDPFKADLSGNDLAIASYFFNKHVNFSGEGVNLPANWHQPWGKLLTKFKSFMFYQARFLKRNVADELFINHNPKPLAAYLAAAGIAGNAAEIVRAFAKGEDVEANRTAIELLIAGIGNAGGAGLFYDTMQQIAERGPGGAWSSIMGPTASDVVYTAQDLNKGDIDKILKRLTPNLPGKQQLYNEWRDQ